MKRLTIIVVAVGGLCAWLGLTAVPAYAHVLVTEVGYDPVDETGATAEFIEVLNPGPAAVWLGDLWIANDEEAYPLLVNGPITYGITLLDFVYRLPGLWLDPGRVLVICHDSDAFLAEHFGGASLSAFTGQPGAPLLVEVTGDGDADGVPGLLDWGSNMPGNLSLANNGECVGLVAWDGASDRVCDQDWVCWLNLGYIPSKDVDYPLGIDGPDPDLESSFFREDLGTARPAPDAPQGSAIHRTTLAEPSEVAAGGNGCDGHDETSEDWSSWVIGPPSPGVVPLAVAGVGGAAAPPALGLGRVAPNPSTGLVRIEFAIPRTGEVALSVHDVSGRRVAMLESARRVAGGHSAAWDGRDASGRPVDPGVYFVRLRFEDAVRMRTVVRVR